MTSLFLIAVLCQHSIRIIVAIISAASLAYVGARSEFVGFLVAMFVFNHTLAIQEKNHRIRLAFLSALLLILLSSIWLTVGINVSSLRSFDLFSIASNTSWLTRMAQISEALRVVLINPIHGDFAQHLRLGDHGDVAHSILSAWVMLGLPGFVLICVLLFGSCLTCIKVATQSPHTPAAWRFAFLLSAMALPQLLLTKSAFVEWLPLVFGSVVSASINVDLSKQSTNVEHPKQD